MNNFLIRNRLLVGSLGCALVISGSLGLMGANGCTQTQQQTDVEVLQIACVALQAGFTAAGEADNATKSSSLCSTLTTDVQSFKAGTPTQDAEQASTDFLNFLSAITPNSKLAGEISVVVNAVIAIISDVPGATPPAATPAVQAHIAMASGGQPAPKTVKDFKAQWNAALAMNPVSGMKPLK